MLSPRERNLLWGANLWYFGEGMFGPLLAVFAGQVGGNILDITYAWAIFLAVTGVLQIFVGRIADLFAKRQGREKIMVLGYALNAFFTFMYLFVHSPTTLFMVQAGLGVATALSSPTWLSLYADNNKKGAGATTWGLEAGASNMIHAVGIVLGGFVVTRYSFTALFAMMGVTQTIATLYQARILWIRGK